jgi:RNA polymerase sigma-70 factor (ECF subfamily)
MDTLKCASCRRFDLAHAEVRLAVERAVRSQYGRCVAGLTRRFGLDRLDLVEDAVQEALARALERWDSDGIPKDVTAWIMRVAHNRVIDMSRAQARLTALEPEDSSADAARLVDSTSLDDELSLMFLCCYPSLPRSAQVALTLRIASGFTTEQIARAFLSDERTIAQRLVRAKQNLRAHSARFDLPEPCELSERLSPLLDVIYLLFTEGYSPSEGNAAIRSELCAEALRLVRLLSQTPSCAVPRVDALRALLCFQASRSAARIADDGSLLLLHEQDRSLWDRGLLDEGFLALGRASTGDAVSRFHFEAGIAACHASAATHETTDWPQIVSLYDELRVVAPSPVVDVNRAVAVAMASGAMAGLDELDAIPERDLIESYPYALAAYAELYASLGQLEEARAYLLRALKHQSAPAQRKLLERKLAALFR